jgi:hypothetical protein
VLYPFLENWQKNVLYVFGKNPSTENLGRDRGVSDEEC